MKQIIFLAIIGLLLVGVSYAAGEYREYNDSWTFDVTTDAGGDSTTGTGSYGAGSLFGFKTLHSRIIVGNATPAYAGAGNLDTVWIRLYSTFRGRKYLVDSAGTAGLPCSLITTLHSNVGDTLLRDNLLIDVVVYDSLGDSAYTATYPVRHQITIK